MTIVRPHKNINIFSILIVFLAAGLVITVFGGMFIYNQLVDLRHEISKKETQLGKIEVENAELRNQFYKLTDMKILEDLAGQKSLIFEKSPKYFENQPLAAVR